MTASATSSSRSLTIFLSRKVPGLIIVPNDALSLLEKCLDGTAVKGLNTKISNALCHGSVRKHPLLPRQATFSRSLSRRPFG